MEDQTIRAVLAELRVPEMPYPLQKGQIATDAERQRQVLAAALEKGGTTRAVEVMKLEPGLWSVAGLNAAYVSDRLFEGFVKKSPLDSALLAGLSPARFWLTARLLADDVGCLGLDGHFVQLMDALAARIGWSDSGRSSRPLLDALEAMNAALAADIRSAGHAGMTQSLDALRKLESEALARREKLLARLIETEVGAARSRAAVAHSGLLINRMAGGRYLPPPVNQFLRTLWRMALRETVLREGIQSEPWKRQAKATEWLVWALASDIAARDQSKLYQVAEQLVDRLTDALPNSAVTADAKPLLDTIQACLVAQVTGVEQGFEAFEALEVDQRYDVTPVDHSADAASLIGRWYLESLPGTQRVYPGHYLVESDEWLMLNESGMRVAVLPFVELEQQVANGKLAALPIATSFSDAVKELFDGLSRVMTAQRELRRKAQDKARQEAEALRLAQETAKQAAAERVVAAERQRAEAERAAQEAMREEVDRQAAEVKLAAERHKAEVWEATLARVDRIKLGGWIEVLGEPPQRLKLAVRTNSSRKMIFTDRLGLNRTEFIYEALAEALIAETVKVLNDGAEFDDALSRVVGRIRVGK